MKNIFFNAHHSPIGAFASFILGYPGKKGGFSLEMAVSPDENIYIGAESAQTPNSLECFPFFEALEDSERERYELESENENPMPSTPDLDIKVSHINKKTIKRNFKLSSDSWQAGDLTFKLLSQVTSIPDPENENNNDELKQVLMPAILAELTLDNTGVQRDRKVFFGYEGSDRYSSMRQFNDIETGMLGIGQGRMTAIVSKDEGVVSGQGFGIGDIVIPENPKNRAFGIGPSGALVGTVPAGTKRTFHFAICFYRAGIVTTGIDTSYYYSQFFSDIEEVGNYALNNFEIIQKKCESSNEMTEKASLSDNRKFMLNHAIKSYYVSTELLLKDDQPLWVVNEGEYKMMNTFDLTVDHLFFETHMNPWVMRNTLDLFIERYSYDEAVHFPDDDKDYSGGMSFTHDMGVGNNFSRAGYSSYEVFGVSECFSHMTHEQLVNWILCATVYGVKNKDERWLDNKFEVFKECLYSLLNRDNPERDLRNGIMGLDSSRTVSEITTYDSLDVSLGQARNNLYLAVKTWAAYIALETVFKRAGERYFVDIAMIQSKNAAMTITSKAGKNGIIPAVFEKGNNSKIIQAIEGLVFPLMFGRQDTLSITGPYADFILALKTHFNAVLKEGVCLFDDGGWKISSSSNNSWLSKIYLSQFVAENILDIKDKDATEKADEAHVSWLTNPEYSYSCWSDQIVAGKIWGSKFYPRGVTSILWLYSQS